MSRCQKTLSVSEDLVPLPGTWSHFRGPPGPANGDLVPGSGTTFWLYFACFSGPTSGDPGPTSRDRGANGPTSRDPGPTSGDPWLQNQVFVGLGGPTSENLVPFFLFFLLSDATVNRLRDLKNVIPR